MDKPFTFLLFRIKVYSKIGTTEKGVGVNIGWHGYEKYINNIAIVIIYKTFYKAYGSRHDALTGRFSLFV